MAEYTFRVAGAADDGASVKTNGVVFDAAEFGTCFFLFLPLKHSAIVNVDFGAGGCNVMESAVVKGKKKKGAQHLHPTTVLCNVTTKGGHQYKVTCRVKLSNTTDCE